MSMTLESLTSQPVTLSETWVLYATESAPSNAIVGREVRNMYGGLKTSMESICTVDVGHVLYSGMSPLTYSPPPR